MASGGLSVVREDNLTGLFQGRARNVPGSWRGPAGVEAPADR